MMMQGGGADMEEKQKMIMTFILINECKCIDKTFNETGIEFEDIEATIKKLNLETDPEFMKLQQEFM